MIGRLIIFFASTNLLTALGQLAALVVVSDATQRAEYRQNLISRDAVRCVSEGVLCDTSRLCCRPLYVPRPFFLFLFLSGNKS
jgi:hypothetical protein